MKKSMIKENKQKNDYVLMLAALLLLILSASAIFWFSGNGRRDNNISQSTPKIIGQAVLTIDFGNDKKRAFEGEIIEGENLVGALLQASKAGDFSYKLDGGNNLASIEDFAAKAGRSWHWYLNDKKIDKSPDGIILKSGDKILIKYE